jgi:hypothetical protein
MTSKNSVKAILKTNNYEIIKEKGTDDNFHIIAKKVEKSQELNYHTNIKHVINIRNEMRCNSRKSEVNSSLKISIENPYDFTHTIINEFLKEKLKSYNFLEHKIYEMLNLD